MNLVIRKGRVPTKVIIFLLYTPSVPKYYLRFHGVSLFNKLFYSFLKDLYRGTEGASDLDLLMYLDTF
jgi:hypothetical protein